MKLYNIGYSLYDDGAWYQRRIRAENDEQAVTRLERLLELLGNTADDIDMFELEVAE